MLAGPTGCTPASKMLGREIRSKLDLLKEPERRTALPSDSYQAPKKFVVGEVVVARDHRNPARRWSLGKVVRVCGSKVRTVEVNGGFWKRHVDQLRRCRLEYGDPPTTSENPVLLWPQLPTANERNQSGSAETENTENIVEFEDSLAESTARTAQRSNSGSDEEFYDVCEAEDTETDPSVRAGELEVNETPAVEPRRSQGLRKENRPAALRKRCGDTCDTVNNF